MSGSQYKSIALFCNSSGIQTLIDNVPKHLIKCIVGAVNRPQCFDELEEIARHLEVPFLTQPYSTHREYDDFCEKIEILNVDLILCYSYSMLIRKEVLRIVNDNAFNIHGSLLPKNRGPNPTQWAILNNESKTGITLHKMRENFDNGEIVAQKTRRIGMKDTWVTVNQDLHRLASLLLKENIGNILKNNIVLHVQDEDAATRTERLTQDSPRLDFETMTDLEIYNWIRSQVEPFKGAYVELHDGTRVYYPTQLSLVSIFEIRDKNHMNRYKSECLSLSPISKEDAALFFKCVEGGDLAHCNELYKPLCETSYDKWFENIRKLDNATIFALKKSDNELAGFCQLHSIDLIAKRAEVQINIMQPENNCDTYEEEAIELLTAYAKNELNLRKIYIYLLPENPEKIHRYKMKNFFEEAHLVQHQNCNGDWKDELIFAKLLD